MKTLLVSIGTVVAALSLTYGLGIASASSSSVTKVGTASSNLGRILVDKHGRTLYLFARDKNGKSACSGACAAYWPPLIASSKPRAINAGDGGRGQTNGQSLDDFGGEWWVLSPAGNKITS